MNRVAFVSMLTLAGLPLLGHTASLKKGPVLTDVTTASIRIAWETAASETGWVEATPTAGGDTHLQNATIADTWHEVQLTSLTAGAHYSYVVHAQSGAILAKGTFRAAATPAQPFRFIVYGDNRSQKVQHGTVVDGMMTEPNIDFAINTGDLVYSGTDQGDWQTFFDIEKTFLADHPIFPVVGNHEEQGGQANLFIHYFHLPGSGGPTYYSFRYGNAFFVMTDGHVAIDGSAACLMDQQISGSCFNAAQVAWLKGELTAAQSDPTITHVFGVTHIGPYSSKPGRTGSAQMRKLLGLYKASKTKILFSGHDHSFEHGIAGNGLPYIVTGGGGAPLYETRPEQALQYPHDILLSESTLNYLVVEVSGDFVQVVAKDGKGKVITSFEIGNPPECVTDIDCVEQTPGPCEGDWTCNDSFECQWACAPPPACTQGTDCSAPQPAQTCDGEWTCPAGECVWSCVVVQGCNSNQDCLGRAPLTRCAKGAWRCDANACEWSCPSGSAQGMADSAGAIQTGSGPHGDRPAEGAGGQPRADSSLQPKPSPRRSSSGCGVDNHQPPSASTGLLLLLMLGWPALRRRRA